MMMKIEKSYLKAEELNNLFEMGYRFVVRGDFKTLDNDDPWSGMPEVTNNYYAFDNKAEAEAFAVNQIWVFDPDIHAEVKTIPAHTETAAEKEERYKKEAAERKAKKEAAEAKKAAEAGMTVKEYRAEKRRVALAKKLTKEIAEMEKELLRKKALLKELEG